MRPISIEDAFCRYLKDVAFVQPEHLSQLMEMVSRKDIKKNEFLLSKGQICQNIFFVEKGLLRFYSIDDVGKEHIIQFAPENWFISDRGSLYFGKPTEFFIDAIEDTSLIVFDQNFTLYASDISAEFRIHNEYLLQNHIRHLQHRIHMLIGAGAEERYLDFIQLYPELTLRIPQWMIATFLGITPESLSRVRKELASRNQMA